MNNLTPLTSLSLKLVGLILVLSSLLDYIILALPFKPLESSWQISYITTTIDRGIIPLVGIAFIVVAYWIDVNTGNPTGFKLKFPIFILSSILGLIFLLFVPVYLTNLHNISVENQKQISQRAAEVEQKLQTEFNQLNELVANPQRAAELANSIQEITKVIDKGELQGQKLTEQQKQILEQRKQQMVGLQNVISKPGEIDKKLTELKNQLSNQKAEQENQAKTETLKQGLRIALSSLMLAVVYTIVGWVGLKNSIG